MTKRPLLSLFALPLCAVLLAPAAQALTGPEKVTSVEGITEYRLPNGLKVLLFPDSTKQTVTVNVTYLVGSRNEGYGETGMAHLLEHLLFKGSPGHRNIPQELTAHGARPNGSTWYDRTNYFETFDASDVNLEWALDLEADRMVHSFVARKDLDTEMTVVRNEFESGENNPAGVLEERVLSAAYLWHNYGHSTIGARSDIERVPIERLQAFYRNYYQPDNAVLLVAGKFDEAKTLAKIVSHFGAIPRPQRALVPTYTEEPTQDGERSVTLRRTGDVQALAVAVHGPPGSHADAAPVELLVQVLADTPSGRLHKALVETKKASSVGGYYQSVREPGFAVFSAEVRQEMSLEEARRILLATLDEVMAKRPPTAEEVERGRTKILKDIELTLSQADRVGLLMSEWIGAGDWRLFFLFRDRLKKASVDDVKRVAALYLKQANRTIGEFIPTPKPDRADIPSTPDVAALVKDYKGEAPVAQGEAFDPSPANIESRTRRETVREGLKLALLPKKTRGGTVHAALTIHFGSVQTLQGKKAIADLTADMLTRGTQKHTRQQIADAFDKLKARVGVSGGGGTASVNVETTRENLAEVMKLVGEVLREPTFPADQLEQLRQENLAGLEQQKSDPQSIASRIFNRHSSPYPKGDIRYTGTLDEDVADYKAATLEQVKAFHAQFYGANRGELAVVGDFDPAQVQSLARQLFGDWKSKTPFERVPREFKDVPATNEAMEAPDKANAFFLAGMNLKLRDDDPDYPALMLGNYMLGGGFLNSRLATRIRQKEGLSYGVGSQLFASALDQFGGFMTFAIYAPQNAAKLEKAFKEEVARMLAEGFTDQELKEARSGYLQSRQVSRAQDGALTRTLAGYLFIDRTFKWDAQVEENIAKLTPASIQAAMKRHVDPAKISVVKAGDFAKAARDAAAAPPAGPVN